jgi:hypothetical protein
MASKWLGSDQSQSFGHNRGATLTRGSDRDAHDVREIQVKRPPVVQSTSRLANRSIRDALACSAQYQVHLDGKLERTNDAAGPSCRYSHAADHKR